ncbi:hypothetical protein [Spiroplasma endosymbiont of Panorpa germanica]|uniref:hypothetical protein n=1 Tax=Spiroplasma endosymbiont of Panorpa germanica TaxID=3066314 RepID=UPI0030CB367D
MEKFNIAWENSVSFNNQDKEKMRMCYICDDIMKFKDMNTSEPEPGLKGWNIDWVDGNINNVNTSNLVATHAVCNENKLNVNGFWLYISKKNYEDKISWNTDLKASFFAK